MPGVTGGRKQLGCVGCGYAWAHAYGELHAAVERRGIQNGEDAGLRHDGILIIPRMCFTCVWAVHWLAQHSGSWARKRATFVIYMRSKIRKAGRSSFGVVPHASLVAGTEKFSLPIPSSFFYHGIHIYQG